MSEELCLVCNKRPGLYEVEAGFACGLHARVCDACGKHTTVKTASLWGYGWYLCSREECVSANSSKRSHIEELYKFAKERAKIERPWMKTVKKVLGVYFLSNLILVFLTMIGVYLFMILNGIFNWMSLNKNDAVNYLFFKQVPTIFLLGLVVFPVELMNEAIRFFENGLGVSSLGLVSAVVAFIGVLISIASLLVSYSIVNKIMDPWRKL